MFPKTELIRIVRSLDGSFSVDTTGKASGRGAYICDSGECAQKCVKKRLLNKSFKAVLPETIYDQIRNITESKS
jgi:predicted RNA-binding protein YlxR (DUF448 family)